MNEPNEEETPQRTGPWLVTEVVTGEPFAAGNYQLTLMGSTTRFNIPGTAFGAVWNRPASVVAETPDGEMIVVPVRDYTRIIQVGLIGVAALFSALLWLLPRSARKT
jgi:hypothetical protein